MGVSVAEEGGLPTTEFTNQFGLKTLHGIPKPAWRAFQLAHEHAGELRLPLTVTEHRPPPPPPAPVPPPPPQGSCVVESSKRCFGDDILPDADHLLLTDLTACGLNRDLNRRPFSVLASLLHNTTHDTCKFAKHLHALVD